MSPSTSKLNIRAFSLVEVVMSIGIVALAFVPLLGLIPSGLHSFRESMDTAIGSQIAQKVINEAIQTDFDTLVDNANLKRDKNGDVTPANFTFRGPSIGAPAFRYFDDQGNELAASDAVKAVYHVLTRINPQVPLPGAGPSVPDLRNLAQVTVQVVTDPANKPIAIVANQDSEQDEPLRNLVDPSKSFPTYTAVALVPRNQ